MFSGRPSDDVKFLSLAKDRIQIRWTLRIPHGNYQMPLTLQWSTRGFKLCWVETRDFCRAVNMNRMTLMYRQGKVMTRSLSSFRVTGSSGAPYTPMLSNGEVNFEFDFEGCVSYLKRDQKFSCLFVNGTSGEGISLTVRERKQLAEKWKSASHSLPIILHIGASNIKDSKELASHADDIGVEAISAVSPSYFRPEREDDLVSYMKEVAIAAPNTPFYYYSINFMTGVYLNDAKFMSLAKQRIPTLRGMKHTTPDLVSAYNCMKVDKELQILFGTDTLFLPCLSLGLDKPIMSPYNGNKFENIRQAFNRNDMEKAIAEQDDVFKLNNIRFEHGSGFNVSKTIFSIISGFDVGPARLPLSNLDQKQRTLLENQIMEMEKSKK